jgi:hypothetical protein
MRSEYKVTAISEARNALRKLETPASKFLRSFKLQASTNERGLSPELNIGDVFAVATWDLELSDRSQRVEQFSPGSSQTG